MRDRELYSIEDAPSLLSGIARKRPLHRSGAPQASSARCRCPCSASQHCNERAADKPVLVGEAGI